MIVGAVSVVALVALVTTALVVRGLSGDGGDDQVLDFGDGPGSEPEEDWAVDLDTTDDDDVAVAADGDRVYGVVTTEDDEDVSATTTVTAYAADDGDELWSEDTEAGSFDDPFRVLDADQVLLSDTQDRTTRLLDAETGDELWEVDGLPVDTQLPIGVGPQTSPGTLEQIFVVEVADDPDDAETILAVDRETGDELWDATGEDVLACGDVVITIEGGETDLESFSPGDSDILARDPETGDELWSRQAQPGLCSEGDVALGTDEGEVTLVDVRTGDDGLVIDTGGGSGFSFAIPAGDVVVVSRFDLGSEEGSARSSIYSRSDGEEIWDEDDVFAFPVSDDLVLAGEAEGDEAVVVRARDGEEVGDLRAPGDDSDCDGALSRRTIVICETGDAEVEAFALDDGAERRWAADTGVDVEQVAIGGDRLFVASQDEVVAFR